MDPQRQGQVEGVPHPSLRVEVGEDPGDAVAHGVLVQVEQLRRADQAAVLGEVGGQGLPGLRRLRGVGGQRRPVDPEV